MSRNYEPDSLCPICGEIFEHLIYNNCLSFSLKNDVMSSNQLGFKQGGSCIYQLLFITHEICQSFGDGF